MNWSDMKKYYGVLLLFAILVFVILFYIVLGYSIVWGIDQAIKCTLTWPLVILVVILLLGRQLGKK